MRRCNALALTILATSTVFAGLFATAPGLARAGGLETQLRFARRDLSSARLALRSARADYELFLSTGATRGSGWYLCVIRRARTRVRSLTERIASLRRRIAAQRLRHAARQGHWLPLVRKIAAQNGISAAGMYRLMSLESGGRASACSGSFHGLYQYCYSTWKGAWNPWRDRSIYDGEAQIRATARAIRKGWGHDLWPNTFPLAF